MSDEEFDSVSESDGATEVDSSSEEEDTNDNQRNYTWTWSNNTSGLRKIPFTKENKMLFPPPVNGTPVDYFFLIMDQVALETICHGTNRYAFEVFFGPNTNPQSRINKWKELTVDELKTFLGVLIHTGTIRLNRIQDYWKTEYLFDLKCFREQMSRDRFLLILRCLHFDSYHQTGTDRLEKVRVMVDMFNNKMKMIYYPAKELSLDESMILFRGRLVFRQYVKNKHNKYGIKLYSLTETDGLVLRFAVYTGQLDDMGGKGHADKVVLHLMKGKLGVGHSIYMDNFYNSVPLASKLLKENTYCTGTLRINRKHLPQAVTKAKLKTGEMTQQYSEGIMVGKWHDKRDVLYISTEYENEMGVSLNKRGEPRDKPVPIIKYNVAMKGIDRLDQMQAYYPFERKTIRWYKKVFIHILQMTLVNAHKLYMFNNPDKKISFYDFRMDVIKALIPKKDAPPIQRPPRNPLHVLSKNCKRDAKGRVITKRCRVCHQENRRKETVFICAQCPGEPGLCAVACYEKWHADK